MGNEIRIKDLNGFLRTAAEQVNEGKDKKLTTEKEISAFMTAADKLVQAGLVQENYKETLGLTITQAATEAPVETPEQTKTKKDLRAERRGQKECKEQVKKSIKNAVGNTVKVNEVHKREVASLDNIVKALNIEYTQPYYAEIIKDVEKVVTLVRDTKFNSKEDVNNIKKEIKKGLNDFQKSIVDDLVELAKEEQIQKETQDLRTLYNAVRKENEGKPENFSNFLKETKTKAKQYNIKGSYSDEAFKRLENELRIETAQLQDNKRAAMVKNNSKNVTGRLVKKELLDGTAEGDKISMEEIRRDKAGNKLTARKLDIDRTAEYLESISVEELKHILGDELLEKLGKSFIEIRDEDGKLYKGKKGKGYIISGGKIRNCVTISSDAKTTLNVRAISDAIAEAVGYDIWMNRDDKNHSEMEKITTKLEALLNVDLTPAEVKKLMDLCHVKTEPKDRNLARALVNSVIPGLVGGAAGGALGSTEISQRVSINVPSDEADKILEQLKGIGGVSSSLNSDGTTTIRVLQSVEGWGPLLGALAGAGAGVAAGTIMSLIFGMENNEDSCFDTATKNITDIDEYAKHINNDQKDNPQKAELIIALAKAYKEAYGEKWSEEYHKDLEKFSGNVTLNCLEFRGGRLFAAKPEKPVEIKEIKALVADKAEVKEEGHYKPVMEEVPTVDASGSEWALITEMYPCLKDKYKNSNDRIRILKLTQAINDGNYTAERLDELLKLSRKGLSYMKNVDGFDFNAYKAVLLAGTIDTIKAPKELAGCVRTKDEPDKANIAQDKLGGRGKGGYAADLVKVGEEWVQTKPAEAAKYALKINGELKEFDTLKEREDAFAEYVKNNKNVKVEKVPVNYEDIIK